MVEDLASEIDRPLATVVATDGSEMRYFIGEAVLSVLLPSFNLPALFTSRGILSYVAIQASISGREPEVEAKSTCLHPGLTELLKDSTWLQLSDQEVHARFVQNVAPRPELSIMTLVEREVSVVSSCQTN